MDQGECLACDVNAGRIEPPGGAILLDELWQADHELTSLVRGYVILKPRRHVHHFADLTDGEAASFGPVLRRLLGAMTTVLAPERIYPASFAETVHHLHLPPDSTLRGYACARARLVAGCVRWALAMRPTNR